MYDVIVIGGGAAGLMAAAETAKRGRKTLLIEHTGKIGEKIRISGGGRCNFTNLYASPANYLSQNKHFMKSAFAGFTQHDFIKLVEDYNIAYHEKTLGQLFCDGSSKQIIDMLLNRCQRFGARVQTKCRVHDISKSDHFSLETSMGNLKAQSVVIASGGLSIPPIGATDFGYRMAKKFGLKIIPTKPALVPLIVAEDHRLTHLSGVSQKARVFYGKTFFDENILFTHKGLSGPAILQISSYLQSLSDDQITMNLLPEVDLEGYMLAHKNMKQTVGNYLKQFLPTRLVEAFEEKLVLNTRMADLSKQKITKIAQTFQQMHMPIVGSEGYKKAEVTIGGVDTNALSSKTMMCKDIDGLYFIGEVVDVTGWLGGYNFQWAWASGFAAGQHA